MAYKTNLFGITYSFNDLRDVYAKANEEKTGDDMAGISAKSTTERIAAKYVLSNITLEEIFNNPVIPYEKDEITRLIIDSVDLNIYAGIKSKTVGELRDFLLSADSFSIKAIQNGLTSEMIAAVTKLMGNLDLIYAASKIQVLATCNTTIGRQGTLSTRLQPNHPTDNPNGILASVRDGLSYGIGDAVIGVNPSVDRVESVCEILEQLSNFIENNKIPTQNCVLAHVKTQIKALMAGAPMDLMFQSIAGSQISNAEFGINLSLLDEAYALMGEMKHSKGENYMYFETGQGSELSSNGHNNADQVVMEARCYGLAKKYKPFLVNTVVGFIGPEYLYDGKQVIRAGLEDHFMGKLSGLPMGCDVCYTNHMKCDQNDNDNLAMLLCNAGCTFFMGIPANDDIMLMYQSTSFHDGAALREISGKRPIAEFEKRMEELGVLSNGKLSKNSAHAEIFLNQNEQPQSLYPSKNNITNARIGVGRAGARLKNETNLKLRADHSIAQDAVWNDSNCPICKELGFFYTQSLVESKKEYVIRPDRARCFSDDEIKRISNYCKHDIDIQIITADGLSPTAIEANIEEIFNIIKDGCEDRGLSLGDNIFVKYGRVATMDKIAEALNAKLSLLFIGERPGLATNKSMSCYMAYEAKVKKGESQRTVVSSIHDEGMTPKLAGERILELIDIIMEQKITGVALDLAKFIEI